MNHAAAPTPPGLVDPSYTWVFDWAFPILGTVIIALAILDTVRRRRFTWAFLFLINSLLVYWMETVGDWGQHLIYSPAFAQHHLLAWLPLKTPNDPLFMPFSYAIYWTVHAAALLYLGQLLMKRFNWSMLKAVLVLAIPVNYVWDMLFEGIAAAMGWWTYDPGIGPVLAFEGKGQVTLLWTVGLMCVWPNLIAYWAGKPPIHGLNHVERFFGLQRFSRPKPIGELPTLAVPPGSTLVASKVNTKQQEFDARLNYEVVIPRWKFELARLGAWFVVFQVSFFILLIVPLLLMRVLTGSDSIYIP